MELSEANHFVLVYLISMFAKARDFGCLAPISSGAAGLIEIGTTQSTIKTKYAVLSPLRSEFDSLRESHLELRSG